MRNFKNRLLNGLAATALLLALICGLTACGNNNDNDNSTVSSTESGKQNAEVETKPTESGVDTESKQAAALTLADGEAKLIYAKDTYAVAAFHGPDGDISAWFCDANGDKTKDCFGSQRLGNGWTLFISKEFPESYDYSGIGLSVTDYDAEKTADGTYPTQSYLNIEQMSNEEMKHIGLNFLDGHCCFVSDGSTMYGGSSFGLTFGITWFDDYYFTPFKEIEGFADRFSYFAGDGTPLENYFEGYSTLEITVMKNMFDVMLVQDSGTNDKEKNHSMCDELKACEPYVIYTGLDGTEQRFDLLPE